MSQTAAQIEIVLNGSPQLVPVESTVADLLKQCGLDRNGVAVALDGRVVPRTQHAQARVDAGQRVEVVQAVGGG